MNPQNTPNHLEGQPCNDHKGTLAPFSWNKDKPRELNNMMLTYRDTHGRFPTYCAVCGHYDFTPVKKEDSRRNLWLSHSGSLKYIEGRLVEGKV